MTAISPLVALMADQVAGLQARGIGSCAAISDQASGSPLQPLRSEHPSAKATNVRSSIAAEDGHVAITVQDNGQGIPRDVLTRIFEPHFSTRTSGSGLGLAISRRLIESWGGTIELSSEEGTGATVRIRLKAV